ncbi:MAG: hypothetical protein KBA33_09900 [Cloacibacterium sp.]|nr:hypothetical protein [Cloacibacterium sp.]
MSNLTKTQPWELQVHSASLMHYLQKNERSFEDNFALTKIENNLQIKDCLNADLMVNQKSRELEFIKAIYSLLFRFNELVNVGKKLNENQMMQLAIDLHERFKTESLEDVALFFKMARQNEFGDFYRLDSIVIESWIPKYMALKAEARERETINQRNIRERQENDDVANHVQDEKAKGNLEKLSKILKGAEKITVEISKENPLFNYDAYLEKLQLTVGKMSDLELETMFTNTSKFSHERVWEILNIEIELRKELEKNKKTIATKKTKKNTPR